jgi:16S rRNA (cytidine1402-2'-O)-methyltransferase
MVPGTLFVVATPIGNLEDITLRALRVLREADVIAAEDTRHTAKLLVHHGISTPTLSFHAHNTRIRLPQLVARVRAGARVALVSDAGTPGISDPGVELVQACRAEGIPVDPIPGPSAPLAAATGAGFPMTPLSILGFAPSRSKDRIRWLAEINRISHTCVFFEAPTRVDSMLREAADILGDRPIVVAREVTKVHQEFVSGTAAFLSGRFQRARGEFTVVLGPWTPKPDVAENVTDLEIATEFWHSANLEGLPRREAIGRVAQKFGKSRREIYSAVERAKNSGQ